MPYGRSRGANEDASATYGAASDQAITILKQIQPISGRYQFVFPGRIQHSKPISEMTLNVLIRRIGYGGRATGHGFRHTMSTILHEQGFNTAWIETQLAHVDKTVFAVLIITLNILMDAVKCFNGMPTMDSLENGENVIHGRFGKRA